MADSKDILVNPTFFVPGNIIDVRYDTTEQTSDGYYTTDGGQFVDEPEATPTIIIDNGTLAPPSEVTVVQQIVRTTADGSLAVDVVLEVVGNTLTTTYETRITKV